MGFLRKNSRLISLELRVELKVGFPGGSSSGLRLASEIVVMLLVITSGGMVGLEFNRANGLGFKSLRIGGLVDTTKNLGFGPRVMRFDGVWVMVSETPNR